MPAQIVYRKLDLATFTGDAWAVDATLATPPADITRLVVTSTQVRWSVIPMSSGAPDAVQVVDPDTQITSRALCLDRLPNGETAITPVVIDVGSVPAELLEPSPPTGQILVLSVTNVVLGAGSAPWLWVIIRGGLKPLEVTSP